LELIFDARKDSREGDELELLPMLIAHKLTLDRIRKLHDVLGIPTDVLIQKYDGDCKLLY